MTKSTEIIKTGLDTETHLIIGRADDAKIYVDIRHYYQNELIDAGDIVISQPEWNLINTNLNRNTQRFYRCPECGDIVTEDEIEEDRISGGYGCCMCKYGNGSRILVEYEPYQPYIRCIDEPAEVTRMLLLESEPLNLTPGEEELIRIIRRLSHED